MKQPINWLKLITEIQAIAQSGLTYVRDEFDKERYQRLHDISAELAENFTEDSLDDIKNIFAIERGHATPKIDVRAFILQNNKLLLVRERCDGLWSLPGGWTDVNESPSEAVVRETKEETGYDVVVENFLALWDKQKHDHPPQWPHAYKCFFNCRIIAGEAEDNLEISELGFFDINNLPSLSSHRVTASQIIRLHQILLDGENTSFD